MNKTILIFGQGGREHALAYHFTQTDHLVVVSPGNAGIAQSFECFPLQGGLLEHYVSVAKRIQPRLIVIGPEDPLAIGVVDALIAEGFFVFGPSKACALLESSKSFMKMVCQDAKIKTASFEILRSLHDVDSFFTHKSGRYVVKADGLCAGKGVVVCDDVAHARQVSKKFLGEDNNPLFCEASSRIVVEEFLSGQEVSVIGICDGEDALLLAPVRDHKRLGEGDVGPNTGGMGVAGPVFGLIEQTQFLSRVKEEVFLPVLRMMKNRGTPYRGFLYAGLMVHGYDIHLLEFNVRLGDPEAQALLYGAKTNLFSVCDTIAHNGFLKEEGPLFVQMDPTAVVVMASRGYPEAPCVGDPIQGLDKASQIKDAQIFFAGVKKDVEDSLVTASGRVLSCVAKGDTLQKALHTCYKSIELISFAGAQYRKDIGHSLLM